MNESKKEYSVETELFYITLALKGDPIDHPCWVELVDEFMDVLRGAGYSIDQCTQAEKYLEHRQGDY
jgi:hypothetical protein